MALIVATNTPNNLRTAIEKAIENDDVVTWEKKVDGSYFHSAAGGQWADEATLRIDVAAGTALVVTISGPPTKNLTVEAYAVYHGRFAQMLLAHFDKMFTSIQITALLALSIGDEH